MSTPGKPVRPSAIDLNKVGHDKLKVKKYNNGQESKLVKMTYDKNPFRIQTPLADVPFGLTISEELDKDGKPIKDSKKPKKYSLDIEMKGSPKLDQFKNVLQQLDTKNIDYIVSQSQEWWGKKMSIEAIADMGYNSVVKSDKKKEYPDRFKLKLPFFDGVPAFKVYDENDKPVKLVVDNEDAVDQTSDGTKKVEKSDKDEKKKDIVIDWSWAQKRMKVEAICECEGLWVVDKKVYCTFKALQLRIKNPESLPDCAFDDTEADSAPATTSVPPSVETKVEDDDDEEGEVEGDEDDDDVEEDED